MRVLSVDTERWGAFCGRSVSFELDRTRTQHTIFAALPEAFEADLNTREDVFLPALVMAACVTRERLDLAGMRIDPLLLRNSLSAARQHADWVGNYAAPAVTNERPSPAEPPEPQRVASFFSGGVDSLFTLIRHSPAFADDPTRALSMNVAMAFHVFHTPRPSEIATLTEAERRLEAAADAFDAKLAPVRSNIMTFEPAWRESYARATHGAGLASIARVFGASLGTALIASSHTYGGLHAWGSSPLVDPLYSGRDLKIVHDGSTFTRFEKTELMARSEAALAVVNVCDTLVDGRGYVNCSRCQKCLRTMTALDLCGKTGGAAPAFDWRAYKPTGFGGIYFKNWSEQSFAEELIHAADARGRRDIADAARSALSRSRLLSPISAMEDALRHSALAQKSRPLLRGLRAGAYRAIGLRR